MDPPLRQRSFRLWPLVAGFLCLLFWAPSAVALDPSVPIRHYTHQQWGTADGLPQSSPQTIVQDSVGYLWLGTQEGLARFDGVRFTVFDTRSTPALPANNVTSVLAAADGSLLVGMRGGGLVRFLLNNTIVPIGRGPAMRALLVRALLEDHRGRIWIGTRGKGLYRTPVTDSSGLEKVPGFSGDRILALLEASDQTIWVGTEGHGLAIIRPGDRVVWIHDPNGSALDAVWALHEDQEGTIWVGAFGGGLLRFSLDGSAKSRLGTGDGLSSDRVQALAEDHQGNLWIGTSGGLDRVRHGVVTGTSRGTSLEGEPILAIVEDREGNLWLGTERSGLHKLGDNRVSVWDEPGKPPLMARVVLQGRDGTMWIGTSGRGLFRLRPGSGMDRKLEPVRKLAARDIFALYEDDHGALWIGTYEEGLHRLWHGRVRSWTTADGLPVNTIWALDGDGRGGVWMGTYGGGLARLRNGSISVLSTESGLPSNLVRCLHTAPDGTLWAGLTIGNRVVPRLAGALDIPPGAPPLEIDYTVLLLGSPENLRFQYQLRGLHDRWIDAGPRRAAAIEHTTSPVAPVITISIGVASTTPSDGADEGDLIRLADEALYEAKNAGRDRVESAVL